MIRITIILAFVSLAICSCGPKGRTQRQRQAAVADTLRAYELHNKAIEYNRMGQPEKALPLSDSAIMIIDDDPALYLIRSLVKGHLGDTSGSVSDGQRAFSLDSLNATASWILGISYTNMGDYDLGEKYLLRSIEIEDVPTVYYNLGLCRYLSGDYQGAIDAFLTHIKGMPVVYIGTPLYYIGNSYAFMGDMEKARQNWDRLNELSGRDQKAILDKTERKPFK